MKKVAIIFSFFVVANAYAQKANFELTNKAKQKVWYGIGDKSHDVLNLSEFIVLEPNEKAVENLDFLTYPEILIATDQPGIGLRVRTYTLKQDIKGLERKKLNLTIKEDPYAQVKIKIVPDEYFIQDFPRVMRRSTSRPVRNNMRPLKKNFELKNKTNKTVWYGIGDRAHDVLNLSDFMTLKPNEKTSKYIDLLTYPEILIATQQPDSGVRVRVYSLKTDIEDLENKKLNLEIKEDPYAQVKIKIAPDKYFDQDFPRTVRSPRTQRAAKSDVYEAISAVTGKKVNAASKSYEILGFTKPNPSVKEVTNAYDTIMEKMSKKYADDPTQEDLYAKISDVVGNAYDELK